MQIPGRDASQIEWYLSRGISSFYRSTFGHQLERAMQATEDSSGERVLIPVGADSWKYISISKEDREPGYELDDEVLERFAKISRRMLGVERLNGRAARTIEVYYGDDGARWGRVSDRIISLYPFTPGGTDILRKLAAQDLKAKVHLDLRASERLANYANMQLTDPKKDRERALRRVRESAEELLGEAGNVWSKTSWDRQ